MTSINHAHLRAFHAVAAEGGFSRAAGVLNVSQPTLSGQVRALEERYGVKLFERRGRGIELTGIGRALFDVTRRLFAQEAAAEQVLISARELTSGQLRVGADAPYHVIPILAAYNRRYPGVHLSLTFGNSERVLDDLLRRRCDVAVLADLEPDPRLHAVPFRRDRLIAFVERGHPWVTRRSIRFAELAGQKVVLREVGSRTRAIFERAAAEAAIHPAQILEIGSREGVREAVAAGLGIGIVFESEFGHDTRLHRLRVRDIDLKAVEVAACLNERRALRAVRAFFTVLAQIAPAL
ncbi:MAG: LysR family transcriptional regulator [Alphaproteobacteria bacterium]|nr:MAG: LysR family transcriptional regulator [Alphaproteobacteria bacterium]